MKRVINLILLVICLFVTTNVFAATKIEGFIDVQNQWTATMTIGGEYDPKINFRHPIDGYYATHKMSFKEEGGSRAGQAFCVFPSRSARNGDTVTCGSIQPAYWPTTYYVVYNYWDTLKDDFELADYVMRTAGIYDRWNMMNLMLWDVCENDQNCNKTKMKEYGNPDLLLASTNVERAFIRSMQAGPLTTVGENPGVDVDQEYGDFVDEDGGDVIVRGNAILTEARRNFDNVRKWDLPLSTKNGEGSYGELIGDKFILSKNVDYQAKRGEAYYNVRTKDGSNVGGICVNASIGNAEVISWDGVSGVIRVWTSDYVSCKVKIKITTGNCAINVKPKNSPPKLTCSGETKMCVKKQTKYVTKFLCPDKTTPKCEGKGCTQVKDVHSNDKRYYCDDGTPSNMRIENGEEIVDKKCIYKNLDCKAQLGEGWGSALASDNSQNNTGITTDIGEEPSDIQLDSGYATESNDTTIYTATPIDRPDLVMYYCSIDGQNKQSYIVVADREANDDEFEPSLECDKCCDTVKDNFKYSNIHNCCEEGVKSYAREYALDELFCKDDALEVAGFTPKCNTDQFLDKSFSNIYCKQYCSSTIQYEIPSPTHAKSDAYFLFKKNSQGSFTGPIFEQFKRCRTIIQYDKFNLDYASIVKSIKDAYNKYQHDIAYQRLWEKLKSNANSTPDSNTDYHTLIDSTKGSCSYTVSYEYDEDCIDYDSPKERPCTETEKRAKKTKCYSDTEFNTKTCHRTNGSYTVTEEFDVGSKYIKVYNESKLVGNYTYSSYDVTTDSHKFKQVNSSNSLGVNAKYYDEADVNAYKDMYNTAANNKKSAMENSTNYKSPSCSGRTDCSGRNRSNFKISAAAGCTKPTSSYDNTKNPDTMINSLSSTANGSKTVYGSYVDQLNGIQNALNTCSGKFNGTSQGSYDSASLTSKDGIEARISFGSEPELEFSYYQEYIGEDGKKKGQEIKVPFYNINLQGQKMDGKNGQKRCVYNTYSSLRGQAAVPGWQDNWKNVGWQDDNYSRKDLDALIYPMGNFNKDITYDKEDAYTYSAGDYYASRKYTTDAVSQMTCLWQDNPKNKTYTLIPGGLVIESEDTYTGKLSELKEQYSSREGAYEVFKTVKKGKYEIYYTLKNIDGGKFDSLIHAESPTCSGYNSVNYAGTPVNLSCYIEVESSYLAIYDCSPGEDCCDSNDPCCKDGRVCGKGGNCLDCPGDFELGKVLDYKEIDVDDPFPFKDQYKNNQGYAYNWLVDDDGKKALADLEKMAKEDSTYSPENLTYSFTLTPADIKAIKAYNKAMVNEGGYTNFNMYCKDNGSNATGTNKKTPVTECKSRFIDAISMGKGGQALTYKGGVLKQSTSNVDLNKVRSKWQ